MGESPGESPYPYWEKWYSIAGPLNKFLAFLVIGLAVAAWLLWPLACGLGICTYYAPALFWVWSLIRLVCGILAGIFYLIFVLKPLANKDLTKQMHIWLIICTALCWVVGTYGWIGYLLGAIMSLQFVMVGILSDVPFWEAFSK
ncbi:MAG: hypothetical protein ACFFD2_04940 [Promethearchaeota archaeon]